MRIATLLMLLLAVVMAVAAPRPIVAPKLTIAVIPKGTTHEFWKSVHAGAIKAARELNVNILWKGPLREDSRDEQIKIVEDMINRKVNAIVLAPLDDMALRLPVASAKKSKIPVVIFDSGLKSKDYVSFVATNNFNGGKMAGMYLCKTLLKGKGRVAMLRYAEGSASTAERERGFLEAAKSFPGIKIVSDNQYGGATTETAYKASENLLAPLKKNDKLTIDGIFCPNESTTFGMLRALQDGGYAGKVKFVGFDSSEKLVAAMQKNELHGLILQNPMMMGYLGVKTAVQAVQGKKVQPAVSTGETLVTRDNMNTPAIKQLLQPDLQKYLGK